MSGSFVTRRIDVTLNIGKGANGEGGFDSYSYSGLRVSAQIVVPGGVFTTATGQFSIYGLPLSEMNKLSSLGLSSVRQRNNTIQVSAGDAVSGTSTVFYGTITEGFADFEGAPDAAFQVQSLAGGLQKIKPTPPTSYKGAVDVATILAGLAKQIGYAFENNGVSVILRDPYLPGTAFDQIHNAAEAADINILLDERQYTVAIWPKTGSRGGAEPKPLISPSTGMVGYPSFAANGLALKTIFNPAIRVGGLVTVKSELTAACGDWAVFTMSHALESQTQGGSWFSQIWAVNPNGAPAEAVSQ